MLDKLEYLIALAAEKHFGRAADRLGITQPTLSAGIRQLEERLGTTLVNRGSRFRGLTEEGERALAWARRITDDVRTMREEVHTVRRGLSGHLRIGAIPTSLAIVSRLTAPFHQKHENVTFEVFSQTATEILAAIENFEIDVGITYLDDVRLRRLDTRVLYEENYCLVTRRDGALGKRDAVSWEEVARLKLGMLSPSMQNRQILNRHLEAGGRRVRAVMESNSMIALLSQARLAGIATVMPYRSAALLGLAEPLVAIPITGPDVGYEIGLVTAKRELRPPIVASFWEDARLVEAI
ncbi:LysR family transcriptional regulator [Jiella sp. MQZ9-1]|uniref:LysR family transcriptional regulator n=1 Tax=Jiella flava TaxID=2816857 RepID=A0A939FWH8_9HYPH|nr:LysR family transcriptional regulator [Jiella flava]MBO0663263.1 LysR family transcriptional regulator [Jiella flava]MCD2471839.1 LysR family transcriptional regulator [Jiella flava]